MIRVNHARRPRKQDGRQNILSSNVISDQSIMNAIILQPMKIII
jgi:hypothetical protein